MNTELESAPVKTPSKKEFVSHGPSAHTVSTGVGLAGGMATGAAVGLAVGSPVGAVIGAVIGAVAGGLSGSAVSPADFTSERTEGAGPAYERLMVPPTHEEIAARAWKYFDESGQTDGHDLDDWLRAESELYREALIARGEPFAA